MTTITPRQLLPYHVHLEDGNFDVAFLEQEALQNQFRCDPVRQKKVIKNQQTPQIVHPTFQMLTEAIPPPSQQSRLDCT